MTMDEILTELNYEHPVQSPVPQRSEHLRKRKCHRYPQDKPLQPHTIGAALQKEGSDSCRMLARAPDKTVLTSLRCVEGWAEST